MRHLIDPLDFSSLELSRLLTLGEAISRSPAAYAHACDGKILATLFYEPSTRTRLSFESAMERMGGKVLGFSSANASSAAKGESVADTARMISCYADICAMRHPLEGAPLRASRYASIPIINAGDGGHQHPTQTLADLLTIQKRCGRLCHLTVGFCGDLKYGRTVHSLMEALSRYDGNRYVLISPEELRVPARVLESSRRAGVVCQETHALESALSHLDVLYMTRIQKERFYDPSQYERLKNSYILTAESMLHAPDSMAVLHPLPRVNEITLEVDSDARAAYFEQAQNGVFMRMALILTLLGLAPESPLAKLRQSKEELPGPACHNKRCITTTEEGLVPLYTRDSEGVLRCLYCERALRE